LFFFCFLKLKHTKDSGQLQESIVLSYTRPALKPISNNS
jgi:hypothetical protein